MSINNAGLKFGGLSNRGATKRIILHHAAGNGSVADMHRSHLNRGWSGIGYHLYVRKDGSIWEGRPITKIGSHTLGNNSDSVGICFEGNFENENMSQAQINGGIQALAYVKAKYGNLPVYGHRNLAATACPGRNFPFDTIIGGTASAPTSTTPEPTISQPLLKFGSRGDSVKVLQSKLADLGYKPGTVDGIFGNNTLSSVKAFQKLNRLTVDGIVGTNTWNALLNSPKSASTPTAPNGNKSGITNYCWSAQVHYNQVFGYTLVEDGIWGPKTETALGSSNGLCKLGTNNALVWTIQSRLVDLGYNLGTSGGAGLGIDNDFGTKTKNAVISFQRTKGLTADGIVGKITWRELCN